MRKLLILGVLLAVASIVAMNLRAQPTSTPPFHSMPNADYWQVYTAVGGWDHANLGGL